MCTIGERALQSLQLSRLKIITPPLFWLQMRMRTSVQAALPLRAGTYMHLKLLQSMASK